MLWNDFRRKNKPTLNKSILNKSLKWIYIDASNDKLKPAESFSVPKIKIVIIIKRRQLICKAWKKNPPMDRICRQSKSYINYAMQMRNIINLYFNATYVSMNLSIMTTYLIFWNLLLQKQLFATNSIFIKIYISKNHSRGIPFFCMQRD